MNLRAFLDYRKDCPLCDSPLVTYFHSKKQQVIRHEDNRIVVIFRLDAIKKHQIDYKVGYSFGLDDHSWYVEFYNQDDKKFEVDSPEFLRNRFKELDGNLKSYKFYKNCNNCERYNYTSNYFNLSYLTGKISGNPDGLCISHEYFGLIQNISDDMFNVYKLYNNYLNNQTTLVFSKEQNDIWARSDHNLGNLRNTIHTSIIKFSSKEETAERIRKLIVFS